MPRHARIVIPGALHHVTQRGNRREIVFFDDGDREFFLDRLDHYCRRAAVQIASYCLMTNHTNLLLIPSDPKGLSKALKPLHMRYSRYLNTKLARTGLNWQGRFFSAVLDDAHSWVAFQYVALNPVRAKLVDRVEAYRWSSAIAHLNKIYDPILTAPEKFLDIGHKSIKEIANKGYVTEHEKKFEDLRRNTLMNIPYASEDYIKDLETKLGRNLTYRPRGRPNKG